MTAATEKPIPRAASPILELDGITRRFGGLTAVEDVSFGAAPGEIVGLIGPNGAGKTTAFNMISGHLRPNAGRIVFDGADITRLSASACARAGIGRTFQIVQPLVTLTVLENVTVGALLRHRPREARERAAVIIERVGMGRLMDQLAGSLTLESRKRLELARALAIEPRVLLLDEILAGLNSAEVNESLDLIRGFATADRIAVVMIEHILHAVMSLAHHIVVLDYGRKIAEGAPEDVVRHPDVIAAYLGSDD